MSEEVRAAVQAVNRKFMEAFREGDAARIAALYADGAKLLPPDMPMMEGAEAIRSFREGAIQSGISGARLETLQVESRGELAYEIGQFTLLTQGDGGDIVAGAGKYVVVWKLQGGEWRLAVDIWNSDTPPRG